MIREAQPEHEGHGIEGHQVAGPAHPPVEEGHHEDLKQGVEAVHLYDDRLRPEHGAEGEQQARRHAARPAEQALRALAEQLVEARDAAEQVRGGSADEQRQHAAGHGARERGEERHAPGGIRVTVVVHEMEDPLEEPREKGPDRIARRVRDAEIVRCDGQLAGVLERDGGRQRPRVDRQRSQGRRGEGAPVRAAEERPPRALRSGYGFSEVFGLRHACSFKAASRYPTALTAQRFRINSSVPPCNGAAFRGCSAALRNEVPSCKTSYAPACHLAAEQSKSAARRRGRRSRGRYRPRTGRARSTAAARRRSAGAASWTPPPPPPAAG